MRNRYPLLTLRKKVCRTAGVAFFGITLLSSCHGARFGDDAGPKTPAEKTRPTDDGEGINGYLTDPSLIGVTSDASHSELRIEGRPGAVARDSGSPEGVVVAVWSAPSEAIPPAPTDPFSITVTNAGCAFATKLGSFVVMAQLPRAAALVLTVGLRCDLATIPIQPSGGRLQSLVKTTGDSGFRTFSPQPSAPGDCKCPDKQYWDKSTGTCVLKPTDSGFGITCPTGSPLVCGCDGINYKDSCQARENGVKRWTTGQCTPL